MIRLSEIKNENHEEHEGHEEFLVGVFKASSLMAYLRALGGLGGFIFKKTDRKDREVRQGLNSSAIWLRGHHRIFVFFVSFVVNKSFVRCGPH